MPFLATADEIQGHLRSAVAGRAHWVVVTSVPTIHRGICFGLMSAILLGRIPDEDVVFGNVSLAERVTDRPVRVSFFTIPKSRVPQDQFLRLLDAVGGSTGRPVDEQDLVSLVTADELGLVIGFLAGAEMGTLRFAPDPCSN